MSVRDYQAVLTIVWVLTICTAAVVTGVASVWALAVIAIIALLPPIAMQLLWRGRAQSISESIREARQ